MIDDPYKVPKGEDTDEPQTPRSVIRPIFVVAIIALFAFMAMVFYTFAVQEGSSEYFHEPLKDTATD
jgi:hypothetical protein